MSEKVTETWWRMTNCAGVHIKTVQVIKSNDTSVWVLHSDGKAWRCNKNSPHTSYHPTWQSAKRAGMKALNFDLERAQKLFDNFSAKINKLSAINEPQATDKESIRI